MTQKWEQKAFMTSELSANLDRAKVSDRRSLVKVGETALSLGHNLYEVLLSHSTIKWTWQKHRKQTRDEIKESLS